MIVSPVSNTYVPGRNQNHDRLTTHTRVEQKVAQKQNRIKERGDSSKVTALMTGTESQPEQHDLEHGNKSIKNHFI